MSDEDTTAEEAAPSSVSIDIRRGNPTDEELAAVVAVVADAYATEVAAATANDPQTANAWRRTQRGLRTPLRRDIR